MARRKLANVYYETCFMTKRISEVVADIANGRNEWLRNAPVEASVRADSPEQMAAFLKDATEFIIHYNDGMMARGSVRIGGLETFRKKCHTHGVRGSTDPYVMYEETIPDGRLYASRGRLYPTKITPEDLPDSYCRFIGRQRGYIRTDGVTKLIYRPSPFHNHPFKDDFLYVFYNGSEKGRNIGGDLMSECDEYVFGFDIIGVIRSIEKHSPAVNTEDIRKRMTEQYNEFVRETAFRMNVKEISSFDEL